MKNTPGSTVPLGNVIELQSGFAFRSADYQEDGHFLVRIANVQDGFLSLENPKYVALDAKTQRFALNAGDMLASLTGNIGRVAEVKEDHLPAALNQRVARITPKEDAQVDRKYLLRFLGSSLFSKHLQSASHGAAQANVSPNVIKEVPIPLPPLEEQQRIVAILDEAFEGLARARAHAEANLQNARELFGSYAKSVFQPHESSANDSESTTVGAVCDIKSGAGFPLKYQGHTSGEHPFYKVSDMNLPRNEWELQEANHYISEGVRLELRARLFPEDSIVFPKVGGAIATNKKRVIRAAGCVDNNVMGLIPDKSKVVSEYIHEWLRAFNIYEFSNKANPPSITQGTVCGWPLRVPSRDRQLQVVATAAALREQTESLRQTYEARLQDLDDLRQSLLQKAFAGELT